MQTLDAWRRLGGMTWGTKTQQSGKRRTQKHTCQACLILGVRPSLRTTPLIVLARPCPSPNANSDAWRHLGLDKVNTF